MWRLVQRWCHRVVPTGQGELDPEIPWPSSVESKQVRVPERNQRVPFGTTLDGDSREF